MREELKNYQWHVYGLSKSDFDYTLRLVNEIIEDRQSQLINQINNLPDKNEEVIDDMAYYNYIDNLYLWTFALWRLQGIFEGILQQEYFPAQRLVGLKAKLNFIIGQGYTINQIEYDQLLDWGNLRNALSHFPPEQFRPININEKDVQEYINLLVSVLDQLTQQKQSRAV